MCCLCDPRAIQALEVVSGCMYATKRPDVSTTQRDRIPARVGEGHAVSEHSRQHWLSSDANCLAFRSSAHCTHSFSSFPARHAQKPSGVVDGIAVECDRAFWMCGGIC